MGAGYRGRMLRRDVHRLVVRVFIDGLIYGRKKQISVEFKCRYASGGHRG